MSRVTSTSPPRWRCATPRTASSRAPAASRQSEKRRIRNQAVRTHVKHLVRVVRAAIAARDAPQAADTLARAARALDKAVTKGVLHRNTAARKIARLAHAVHELGATGAPPPAA
ncbi:MAG: 30S ribosomal protein S20 [Deltaproteobacteria bacterium]|nr:MAG: 30S ribosomal protein S20 [Deltaproteobacteria bacterium]